MDFKLDYDAVMGIILRGESEHILYLEASE